MSILKIFSDLCAMRQKTGVKDTFGRIFQIFFLVKEFW